MDAMLSCKRPFAVVCILTFCLFLATATSGFGTSLDEELFTAIEQKNIGAVKNILAKGADVEARDTTDTRTPLMLSAVVGDKAITALLIGVGADVNAISLKDGWVPLMHAVFFKHPDVVELLLETGANINAIDHDGNTALMQAAYNGTLEIVHILLRQGADVGMKDQHGQDALSFAKLKGNPDIIHLLEAYVHYRSGKNTPIMDRQRIIELQQALDGLGYPIGTIDGKMGGKTEEAIQAFQKDSGLLVNGEASEELLSVISAHPEVINKNTQEQSTRSSPEKFSCQKKYCKDIPTCEEAYYLLKTCGYKRLDRDKDGVPCENICPGG